MLGYWALAYLNRRAAVLGVAGFVVVSHTLRWRGWARFARTRAQSGSLCPCDCSRLRRRRAPLALPPARCRVPALLGVNWAPSAAPLPWASAGLLVSGPISVAAAGYLYSESDVRTPLVATIINGVVWIALTAILLRPLGIAAVGISWMVASWTEAVLFARALWRAGVAVSRMIQVPVAVAVASALLALAVKTPLSSSLVPGIATATVAVAAYLALSFAFNRADLVATARRVRSLT